MKKILLLLVIFAAVAAPAATGSSAPLQLGFDKVATAPGVWDGTTSGDIAGALEVRLQSLNVSGPIWVISVDFAVGAGDQSFTARLSGTLSTETGAIVLNGTIIHGYLEGAQTHLAAQVVDPTTFEVRGTLQIMPATAG